jgi:TM2 domain-containing membrane protein YozV
MIFLWFPKRVVKSVNKSKYELLALFMGWVGLHKFYAGKCISGIFYALFFWTTIPAYLSIFDFIIALFKKRDSNGRIWI